MGTTLKGGADLEAVLSQGRQGLLAPPSPGSGALPSGATDDATATWLRALEHEGRSETHAPPAGETPRADGSASDPPSATDPFAAPHDEGRRSFDAGATLGHYEVIRPLGQGGMGEVFLARDTRLGRRVALKFLRKVNPERAARFTVEARATARLTHENIVALYDIAEHQGMPYMVLEFVPGKALSAWLRERRDDGAVGRSSGVSPSRAAELMLPVARALMCAHEAGIVHRDLKPANIMLADSGTVKVLDFGIAKLLGEAAPEVGARAPLAAAVMAAAASGPGVTPTREGAEIAMLTRTGTLLGTQAYMAPEQWWSEPVDGRADLWAMGIMLFQLVTGDHPLAPLWPETLVGVAVLDEPMPSVYERLPEIGPLGAVIDRCLLKHKADRLGSARELCDKLEAIARPHATASRAEDEEANPYAGLAAFQERDATRFFGREALIEQIVTRLAEQPLLALVGSSGAGKSSLMRAGVIPALKRGGDAWEAFVLRPGPHPLAALAALLLQHAWQRSSHSLEAVPSSGEDSLLSLGDPAAMVQRLRQEPGFFGVQARSRARRRRERVLVFVDQFEEVYTLAPEDERDAFLACLSGAADDPSSPLRIVVSLRHDFLDRVAASASALAELVSRGTVLVGPLDRRGLTRALLAPAEALSYRFESEALVAEMLDALAGAASALPLLQFTAEKLWQARDRDRRLLTEASYRAFGGVSGALASHADRVLDALSSAERRCARMLVPHLVTPERTRAIVTRRELAELGGATAEELNRVLDRLIEARLVTVEGAGRDESTVELIHESLIATWPTLARWLEEAQDDAQFRARLRAAAKQWEAGGLTEGLLWRGEAAEEARRFRKRQGEEAGDARSAREERYLAAVVRLDERERRRRRQLLAALFGGLCVVVVLVSALALRSSREAKRAEAERVEAQVQRTEAERSATSARNATRLAAAQARQSDPTAALALLREIEPGPVPRGWADLARWALGAGVSPVVLRHDATVSAAAFSPDGQRIVSASADNTVRVWNADGSGMPIVLRGHDHAVLGAAWSPDGQRIVSASEDNTVRVWNADGSGMPIVLRSHDAVVGGAAWSPDGQRIVSASWDKTVRVWNADGSGMPIVLRGHDHAVLGAAWSPDGQRIVSTSEDKTVRVWNADGSGMPIVLRSHDAVVGGAAWSPDGQRIVSTSEDKTVRVWNADGSGMPIVLRGHDAAVGGAAWSPDGQRIVFTSEDKTVRVWNADGSGMPIVLRGHDAAVTTAHFSPDGQRIISASEDKTVRVWNADGSGQPIVLRGHDDRVWEAAFSFDGQRIVSTSADRTVRVWKADSSGTTLVLRGHDDTVLGVAWSPDGQRIVSASMDKTVRVWNADGSGMPLILRGHDAVVVGVAWSPDGQRIVSASMDKTVRVWNADGSGTPLILRGHDAVVFGVAWSPDGQRIVSASYDKTVRVWNADGSGQHIVLRGHDDAVGGAAWSPDSQRIVSSSRDKTVRVWNADGAGIPLILRGHDAIVFGAAWSPDGQRIVSASMDKTVRVWNADGSGQPIVLRGHEAAAGVNTDRAFSPDGTRIVSASDDGTVRVWNADGTGEPLVLRTSNVAINSAAWSPDGQRIVAASDDKTVIIWSDLAPLRGADDPKLWAATTYCPPIELRQRLLGFSEEQARSDLTRCQQRVREAARTGQP